MREYLLLKFPPEMVETILYHLKINSDGAFDDFCRSLDGLVFMSKQSQKLFIFECFDINHDKYICQHDAWKVMEYDTESRYSEDVSHVVEAL